jgi:hypothetical protein
VLDDLELRRVCLTPATFGIEWQQPPPPTIEYELALDPTYGVGGTIQARRVSITMEPGSPSDNA